MRIREVAKIVNIHMLTSCEGWGAVYASEKEDAVGNPFEVRKLIATGVMSDDEKDSEGGVVVGFVAEGGEFVPAVSPTFLGYLEPGQSVEEFEPVLAQWKEDQAEDVKLKTEQLKAKITEEKKRSEN